MNINIELGEIKIGKGYGKDMSVNALLSLEKEEKPITKWNKDEIIDGVINLNQTLNIHTLNCLSEMCLKDKFLSYKGWHHVGDDYKQVGFYSLNEEYIKGLNDLELQNILIDNNKMIADFKRDIKVSKIKHKSRYMNKKSEKVLEYNISKVLPYTNYKSMKQLKKDIYFGSVCIDELLKLREDAIKYKWGNLLKDNIESDDIEYFLGVCNVDIMERIISENV